MYENSKRYTEGKAAALYLCTAEATVKALALKEGEGAGVVRAVLQLAAMRASGLQVTAADMAEAALVSEYSTDINLAAAKRAGWVRSDKGKLSVTSTGRKLVADAERGWQRAARKLQAHSNALPFRKRAAKPQADQA
jgi:hypothetical protein